MRKARRYWIVVSLLAFFCVIFNTKIDYEKNYNNSFTTQKNMIEAIMWVESRGDETAHNESTDAVGVLQIRKILVDEVNRLYGTKFTYEDRWDREKSISMFILIQRHYNPEWDLEKGSRIWNGGPRGHKKKATLSYYKQVKKRYYEN